MLTFFCSLPTSFSFFTRTKKLPLAFTLFSCFFFCASKRRIITSFFFHLSGFVQRLFRFNHFSVLSVQYSYKNLFIRVSFSFFFGCPRLFSSSSACVSAFFPSVFFFFTSFFSTPCFTLLRNRDFGCNSTRIKAIAPSSPPHSLFF